MSKITKYLELDQIIGTLNSETPKVIFTADINDGTYSYGSSTKKQCTYIITYSVKKRYFIEHLYHLDYYEGKNMREGYKTKEHLLEVLRRDLLEGNFKDKDYDENLLSETKFEVPVQEYGDIFEILEGKKDRERKKISNLILMGYQEGELLGFGVPILNTTASEKRYDTVKNWTRDDGFCDVIVNSPIKGISRLGVTSRYSTSNKFVEYLDPRGFVLQLSAESSNELTKGLEELGTSLEDTECVWDCSGRSPKILPIKLYSIDFQNGDLSSETQRKYIKPRSKKEKFHLRVLNGVYLGKYKTLDIQSVEKPGLIILLNLINKSLVYLSHSQFVELYSRDIEHLNIDFSLDFDKLYSIERSVIESLVKSGRFIEADSFIEEVLEMK